MIAVAPQTTKSQSVALRSVATRTRPNWRRAPAALGLTAVKRRWSP